MSGADGDRLNVALANKLHHALLCDFIVLDNEQALDIAVDEVFEFSEDFAQLLRSSRLALISHRTHLETTLTFFIDGQDMDGNMPRRPRVLQAVEDTPTIHARQFNVQRNRARRVLPRK